MGFLEVGHQRCQCDFYGHALPQQQQPWELTLHRMHYQGHVWPLELVPTLPLQPLPAAQEKRPIKWRPTIGRPHLGLGRPKAAPDLCSWPLLAHLGLEHGLAQRIFGKVQSFMSELSEDLFLAGLCFAHVLHFNLRDPY